MNLSAGEPVKKRYCRAHKKNGDPCGHAPINGTTVCRWHGGNAPQVKRKAKQRLEEAADRMARALLRMAEGSESEAVKLAAIKDALDRAGLNPKQAHEISVSAQPWETILQGVVAVPRPAAEPEREAREGDVIDVEWFEGDSTSDAGASGAASELADGPPACGSCGRPFPAELPPELDAYPELCGDCRQTTAQREPTSAAQRESPPLVTFEEGVASAAAANRRAGVVALAGRRPRPYRPDGPSEFAG